MALFSRKTGQAIGDGAKKGYGFTKKVLVTDAKLPGRAVRFLRNGGAQKVLNIGRYTK